jgi:hypothetical protein
MTHQQENTMKKLLCLILLTSMSFAQAGDKANIAGKTTGAAALGVAAKTAESLSVAAHAAPISLGSASTVLAYTGVTLAGATGYMIGTVIVKVDQVYFKGSLVSHTGQFLGPINRRIYNMLNDDQLPEEVVTKDGSLKVISQGERQ